MKQASNQNYCSAGAHDSGHCSEIFHTPKAIVFHTPISHFKSLRNFAPNNIGFTLRGIFDSGSPQFGLPLFPTTVKLLSESVLSDLELNDVD